MNTPIDDDEEGAQNGRGDGDGDHQQVGVMSDCDDSDVDDDIADPDWDEVKAQDSGGDDDVFSFKPDKMPSLPQNGIIIDFDPPKKATRRSKASKKKTKKNGRFGSDDEESEGQSEEDEDPVAKKKRRTLDVNEVVRKSINRVRTTEQLLKHKISLLLYLARGLRLVKIINCNIIKGLSISVVENNFKFGRAKRSDRAFLAMFMERFNDLVMISDDDDKRSKHMQQLFMQNLLECFANLETTSLIELVVMFVACLRSLKPNLPIRVVNVLRPVILKPNIIPKPPEGEPMKEVKVEPQAQDETIEKLDYWVEVYLQDEKKWCCLDLCNAQLDEPRVLTELSRPFKYLVSYDVDRYCVKAAEKNYCEDWYTAAFKKGRCEDKWWDALMNALGPSKKSDKDLADETKTEEILTKQDMPTSDLAFKKHPIYVLEKHLLKFQGIYPPEVAPLGFFKDQPVYPRDCVQILRSRETWLREARTVKLNETAYKIVKARPKLDKFTGEIVHGLPLELFGEWQTDPYDPPQATDGKVPRNCYGNVDMYKPCMLPKGCVWLKLPGLQRVATKLKIDCAAAVVGFDNHCGGYGSHPVIDGFIVCEEYADTLRAAWDEEQVNIVKRDEEKRQKRIWDNWRRLLKAAIIRERLRVKYKNS